MHHSISENTTPTAKVPTHILCILLAVFLIALFLPESYRNVTNVNNKKLGANKTTKNRLRRSINDYEKDNLNTTSLSFIDEHLNIANKYRALHGSPPLEIDYQLCVEAERWAQHLAAESDKQGKLIVDPSWKYATGENIFGKWTNDSESVSGTDVANNWYSDCAAHWWDPNKFVKDSSRFTQMVWKSTKQMGIGKALALKQGLTIVVARYLPAGNLVYASTFKSNVFPITKTGEKCYQPSSTENITSLTVSFPAGTSGNGTGRSLSSASSSSSMTTEDPLIAPMAPSPDPFEPLVDTTPAPPTPCPFAANASKNGRSLTQANNKNTTENKGLKNNTSTIAVQEKDKKNQVIGNKTTTKPQSSLGRMLKEKPKYRDEKLVGNLEKKIVKGGTYYQYIKATTRPKLDSEKSLGRTLKIAVNEKETSKDKEMVNVNANLVGDLKKKAVNGGIYYQYIKATIKPKLEGENKLGRTLKIMVNEKGTPSDKEKLGGDLEKKTVNGGIYYQYVKATTKPKLENEKTLSRTLNIMANEKKAANHKGKGNFTVNLVGNLKKQTVNGGIYYQYFKVTKKPEGESEGILKPSKEKEVKIEKVESEIPHNSQKRKLIETSAKTLKPVNKNGGLYYQYFKATKKPNEKVKNAIITNETKNLSINNTTRTRPSLGKSLKEPDEKEKYQFNETKKLPEISKEHTTEKEYVNVTEKPNIIDIGRSAKEPVGILKLKKEDGGIFYEYVKATEKPQEKIQNSTVDSKEKDTKNAVVQQEAKNRFGQSLGRFLKQTTNKDQNDTGIESIGSNSLGNLLQLKQENGGIYYQYVKATKKSEGMLKTTKNNEGIYYEYVKTPGNPTGTLKLTKPKEPIYYQYVRATEKPQEKSESSAMASREKDAKDEATTTSQQSSGRFLKGISTTEETQHKVNANALRKVQDSIGTLKMKRKNDGIYYEYIKTSEKAQEENKWKTTSQQSLGRFLKGTTSAEHSHKENAGANSLGNVLNSDGTLKMKRKNSGIYYEYITATEKPQETSGGILKRKEENGGIYYEYVKTPQKSGRSTMASTNIAAKDKPKPVTQQSLAKFIGKEAPLQKMKGDENQIGNPSAFKGILKMRRENGGIFYKYIKDTETPKEKNNSSAIIFKEKENNKSGTARKSSLGQFLNDKPRDEGFDQATAKIYNKRNEKVNENPEKGKIKENYLLKPTEKSTSNTFQTKLVSRQNNLRNEVGRNIAINEAGRLGRMLIGTTNETNGLNKKEKDKVTEIPYGMVKGKVSAKKEANEKTRKKQEGVYYFIVPERSNENKTEKEKDPEKLKDEDESKWMGNRLSLGRRIGEGTTDKGISKDVETGKAVENSDENQKRKKGRGGIYYFKVPERPKLNSTENDRNKSSTSASVGRGKEIEDDKGVGKGLLTLGRRIMEDTQEKSIGGVKEIGKAVENSDGKQKIKKGRGGIYYFKVPDNPKISTAENEGATDKDKEKSESQNYKNQKINADNSTTPENRSAFGRSFKRTKMEPKGKSNGKKSKGGIYFFKVPEKPNENYSEKINKVPTSLSRTTNMYKINKSSVNNSKDITVKKEKSTESVNQKKKKGPGGVYYFKVPEKSKANVTDKENITKELSQNQAKSSANNSRERKTGRGGIILQKKLVNSNESAREKVKVIETFKEESGNLTIVSDEIERKVNIVDDYSADEDNSTFGRITSEITFGKNEDKNNQWEKISGTSGAQLLKKKKGRRRIIVYKIPEKSNEITTEKVKFIENRKDDWKNFTIEPNMSAQQEYNITNDKATINKTQRSSLNNSEVKKKGRGGLVLLKPPEKSKNNDTIKEKLFQDKEKSENLVINSNEIERKVNIVDDYSADEDNSTLGRYTTVASIGKVATKGKESEKVNGTSVAKLLKKKKGRGGIFFFKIPESPKENATENDNTLNYPKGKRESSAIVSKSENGGEINFVDNYGHTVDENNSTLGRITTETAIVKDKEEEKEKVSENSDLKLIQNKKGRGSIYLFKTSETPKEYITDELKTLENPKDKNESSTALNGKIDLEDDYDYTMHENNATLGKIESESTFDKEADEDNEREKDSKDLVGKLVKIKIEGTSPYILKIPENHKGNITKKDKTFDYPSSKREISLVSSNEENNEDIDFVDDYTIDDVHPPSGAMLKVIANENEKLHYHDKQKVAINNSDNKDLGNLDDNPEDSENKDNVHFYQISHHSEESVAANEKGEVSDYNEEDYYKEMNIAKFEGEPKIKKKRQGKRKGNHFLY